MIVSRTPFRISFAGGGTDLPAFFTQEPGGVLSTTINQYVYVAVNRRFEPEIRISYSKTEIVPQISQIEHDLVREALRRTRLTSHTEVVTIADIPAGTGLGSSGSLTVGLLNALYAFQGRWRGPEELAEEACEIEINTLGRKIGKQDQYAAAFGGLRFIQFDKGRVISEPASCSAEILSELERNLMLFFTGVRRSAPLVRLEDESNAKEVGEVRLILRALRDLAIEMRGILAGKEPLDRFGQLLHEGWELKKHVADGISTPLVEQLYSNALRAGAIGGKLLGAGGGGCLLLYCPRERQQSVRRALRGVRQIGFALEPEGSTIIYSGR